MALPDRQRRKPSKVVGHAAPRLAPPVPARSRVSDFEATAADLGIKLIPWQQTAGRYIYASGKGDVWQWPEVCAVVARQQGKTEMLVPHIVTRLRMGRRIVHGAQNRELPRHVFNRVASFIETHHPDARVRRGQGQETIEMRSSPGLYKIVAPSHGGARGGAYDDLIIDEVRELRDMEFIGAATPTLAASLNPQILYLSNAGEDDSLVLNTVRLRAETDPALAYLEWSAAPERASDDRPGWLEANPAIGHFPAMADYLERVYHSHTAAGTLAIFETEHLCRWVRTTRARLIDDFAWRGCHAETEAPVRPALGMMVDPDGKRASVAMAWRQADDTIGLRLLFHVTGDPIDTDALGVDVRRMAARVGATAVGFDPMTATALAKFVKKPKPEPISGQKFANATAQFVHLVHAGRLRWSEADAVTDDLVWTTRKHDRETGTYEAVRADDNHPITASLAAIRAVWLASTPTPPRPKVL